MTAIAEAHILIMASDGFEESELFGPLEMLREAGAKVTLAAPQLEEITGEKGDKPGRSIEPDITISDARAEDYDGLVLPGGTRNPDHLRMNEQAVALVRAFAQGGKPVAAICHGPWLLVEADVVRGRTVTSWPSIRTDLRNAGATVIDQEAVTDANIVTSRNPDDVPAFTRAFISLVEGSDAPLEGV